MKRKKFIKVLFSVLACLFIRMVLQCLLKPAGLGETETSALGSIIFVIPLYFAFWHYNGKKKCGNVPALSFRDVCVCVLGGICLAVIVHDVNPEKSAVPSVLNVLGFGVAGPVIEEILYRGYVQREGAFIFGEKWSVVFSVLLFAAGHDSMLHILFAVPAGLLFSVSYGSKRHLLLPALSHITANLLSFFLPAGRYPLLLKGISWLFFTASVLFFVKENRTS